jgi:4-hydroxy-2-oxoglutarate aldolase
MQLGGIFPALATPFDADGVLAPDRLRENIERYNRTGLSGYLVVGSTGESVLLSRTEIEQAFAAVREAAAPGRVLIAGTGAESTAETISRTQAAARLGYHFALVMTPQFFKPQLKPDTLIAHYRRVADASPIPVLLYSVPQFTGVALEVDVVARLAEHPNVAGMKDSSGNVERLGAILASVPPGFQLLTGAANTFYPAVALGVRGGILALADFLPELCLELYQAAAANDVPRARELQQRILPASKKIVGEMGVSGVKYAMERRGYYGGPVRLPLLPLGDAQKREVESLVAAGSPAAAAR